MGKQMIAGGLAAALWAAEPASASLDDPVRRGALAVAGSMTADSWETVLGFEDDIQWTAPRLVGGGAYLERAVLWHRLWVGAEALALLHMDADPHWEVTLPATLRYRALDPWVPFQGAAAGLGVSYATATPELEIARKGESNRFLLHWFVELEFGRTSWAAAPFLRLHHRSDGFGLVDVDTGSNGVLLGLRVPF